MSRAETGVRAAAANPRVVRLLLTHLLAVIAEYAVVVGVLVYAFERGGSGTTGLSSLAILLPTCATQRCTRPGSSDGKPCSSCSRPVTWER